MLPLLKMMLFPDWRRKRYAVYRNGHAYVIFTGTRGEAAKVLHTVQTADKGARWTIEKLT